MALFGKIRRTHFRGGLSISEIARRTSLSRNTIKRWLAAEGGTEPKYQRAPQDTKLTPFEASLRQWLETDRHRPQRERRTALALFGELQKLGYAGSYPRVSAFVREWRDAKPDRGLAAAFAPLRFALGEAFQFGWSEEPFVIGGIHRRLQVAHIKLCASRAFLLAAYFSRGQEMLFDAHTRGFTVFGGVPRRGIYDNMETAVDRVLKGKARIVNSRFSAPTAHYLSDPELCNVAAGWEKGRVEKNVQDSRRRLWDGARQHRFGTLEELNRWLERRCRELWSEVDHPDRRGITVAEAFALEQPYLMPMPTPFDGYVEWVARVSSTCLVAVHRNRYSVPCALANQKASVRLYASRIEAYADDALAARHDRLFDRDQVQYDWRHYLPLLERKPGAPRNGAPFADLPESLQRLKAALLRRPGGDRIMVQVLACVPTFGLEAAQVAADLVLESGPPGLEHVRNALSRLNEPAPLATVGTVLALREEPRADAGRYDRLQAVEAGDE
ncbi:MAG: IS21 family transposase [Nitrospirae bacterium]|nr:MAG: IS21 family transposase [Nitrospirota bacterium]